jgi:4-hydroxybenzoate polyprenyltransferase
LHLLKINNLYIHAILIRDEASVAGSEGRAARKLWMSAMNTHAQIKQAAKFSPAVSWFTIIYRCLRLHQWAKNGLIFVPLILGGKGGQSAAWLNALIGFLAIGFAASSTYIVNDLHDLTNDRKHRSKRTRPLANGDLSVQFGLLLAIAGLIVGFLLAAYASVGAVTMLALYVALSLSYSFYWKCVPILDAFVLASLFTCRLGMGVALTDVRLSLWLFIFSMFIFTSLCLAKRNTEVLASTESAGVTIPGRGYVRADAPLILALGMGTGMSAVVVMILYLIEDAYPRQFYANPDLLWALPAMVFLFLGRVWLLSERRQMHDDPVAFALTDRVSLLLGLLMSLALAASFIRLGPI